MNYAAFRDNNAKEWQDYHHGLMEMLGLRSPWGGCAHPDALKFFGTQQPQNVFHRIHAACTQAVAKHGPLDTSLPWNQAAWHCRVVRDASKPDGWRIQFDWKIDASEIMLGVLAAIVGLALTVLFPPIGLIAGFLGTVIVGVIALIIVQLVREWSQGGYRAEQQQPMLDQLAMESLEV